MTSRFQTTYRKNASKLHKTVGDILREDPLFSGFVSYQEYPVSKVNPRYHTNAHHFDWVIPKLKVVIECHGRQHYEIVSFGGDADKGLESFHGTQLRDRLKKRAAIEAGWTYVIVKYDEVNSVTGPILFARIEREQNVDAIPEDTQSISQREIEYREQQKEKRREYLKSDRHKEQLAKAREFQRQQYKRLKERKNGPQ